MKTHQTLIRIATVSLLSSVSLLGIAGNAHAAHVLFSTESELTDKQLKPGQTVVVNKGTTQIMLDSGAIAAFVNAAQFAITANGSLDLKAGTVTVVAADGKSVDVNLPANVRGSLRGANSAASFTVDDTGSRGSVISGNANLIADGVARAFAAGNFWSALIGHGIEQVVANAAAAVPGSGTVQPQRSGGIAAAAQNGVPVALGEALAAVGVNGDILSAAHHIDAYDRNPTLATFPSGDYAALTAYAAQAANPFGGVAFSGASADIIKTYLQYLSTGGVAAQFQASYASILVSYLDLLRSGGVPSGFTGATQAQLAAYLDYIKNTVGFGSLSVANNDLLKAYLAFLSTGGTANQFGSAQLAAYQGDATALLAYYSYLVSGGLPSAYSGLTQAQIQAYLQALTASGQLAGLLGTNATFFTDYFSYLAGGGAPDQYGSLPTPTPPPPPVGPANLSGLVAGYLPESTIGGTATTSFYRLLGEVPVTLDAAGNPIQIATFTNKTASFTDVHSAPGWMIGRFNNGVVDYGGAATLGANDGVSFAIVGPAIGTLPVSGTGTYKLLSATLPTFYDGHIAPAGNFNATIGIVFGVAPKLGFDGTLTLPEAGGSQAYAFTTVGGSAAPSIDPSRELAGGSTTIYREGNHYFINADAPVAAGGSLCVDAKACRLVLLGITGGQDGGLLAANYIFDSFSNPASKVHGAAVFGLNGASPAPVPAPAPAPTPTPPPSSGGTTPTGSGAGALATSTGVVFDNIAYNVFNNAPSVDGNIPVIPALTLNSLGELQSVTKFNTTTGRGTAINTDVFANGTVGIGRWTGGTLTSGVTLSNNQSYNYAVALPAATLPTSGSATYNLLSATAPTFLNGISGQGSVTSATLAVTFGAASHIGFEAALSMPEAGGTVRYALSSVGGIANPAASDLFFFTDALYNPYASFEGSLTLTPGSATNIGCNNAATCDGSISGALAGSDLSGAVVTYQAGATTPTQIIGAIALGKGATPAPTPPPPPPPPPPAATTLFPGFSSVTQYNATGGSSAFESTKNIVQLDGTIDSLGSFAGTISRNTAIAGNAGFAKAANGDIIAWNRWTNGTIIEPFGPNEVLSAKQGDYITVGRSATNQPTSGIVHFSLLGATAPTFTDGSAEPGTFSGNMTINFATNRLGLDFLIGLDGQVYTLRTPGDPQNPLDLNSGASIAGISAQLGVSGGLCSPVCSGAAYGLLYGNGATQAGLNYLIRTGAKQIVGSAAFGSGTQTVTQANPVPPPPPQPAPATTGAPTGNRLIAVNTNSGSISPATNSTLTAQSDGRLDVDYSGRSRGTAVDKDFGGLAGLIGWSRWSGGALVYKGGQSYPTPAGGVHTIWGSSVVSIPLSGTATYDLAGSTAPTDDLDLTAPGTVVSAKLAVAFTSMKVGFETNIAIGGQNYALSSAGGVAAPSQTLGTDATFNGTTNLQGTFYGFLAGTAASHAGLGYTFYPTGGPFTSGNNHISGVIAFTKH